MKKKKIEFLEGVPEGMGEEMRMIKGGGERRKRN